MIAVMIPYLIFIRVQTGAFDLTSKTVAVSLSLEAHPGWHYLGLIGRNLGIFLPKLAGILGLPVVLLAMWGMVKGRGPWLWLLAPLLPVPFIINPMDVRFWIPYLPVILLAAGLGVLPGCMGPFAIVTLHTHGIASLGAVVTVMIASTGDAAFYMLAVIPKSALGVSAILFGLAIVGGALTDRFLRWRQRPVTPSPTEVPPEEVEIDAVVRAELLGTDSSGKHYRGLLVAPLEEIVAIDWRIRSEPESSPPKLRDDEISWQRVEGTEFEFTIPTERVTGELVCVIGARGKHEHLHNCERQEYDSGDEGRFPRAALPDQHVDEQAERQEPTAAARG